MDPSIIGPMAYVQFGIFSIKLSFVVLGLKYECFLSNGGFNMKEWSSMGAMSYPIGMLLKYYILLKLSSI